MPYRDAQAERLAARERKRRQRARERASKAKSEELAASVEPLALDPVEELSAWAASTLKVPPGHPKAGDPMALPSYAEAFLRDALGAREALLCMGRKNAKSAICAVLGYLAGPLARPGWRGAVASLSIGKANELRNQVEAIAVASGLQLEFRRSSYPGLVSSGAGQLETLSADRTAGHASSFDLVLVDELGLFPERSRELMAGLRSSISAKDGRLIAISVRGDSPLLQEMIDRAGPACAVHLHSAPDDCELDDEAAWAAANPGISEGIKSLAYMRDESARVLLTPSDQPSFRAFDLNQRLDPSREMVVTPDQWRACEVADLPPRRGPVHLGIDLGGSSSMTAAVAYWHETGRIETWAAFPAKPGLRKRGQADGVAALYEQMAKRGELLTIGDGQVTDIEAFLSMVADALKGERIAAVGADRYRRAE